MFSLSSTFRYYFYNSATDMRKGFDGLCGLVHAELGRRPVSGEVFIFVNGQRDKIKLLHWEEGGFVLYYKRLERGTFELPKLTSRGKTCQISWSSLMLMLQTDGYNAYDIYEKKEGITLHGCMAHARRKFESSKDNDPERAEYVLDRMKKLYMVEREARENNLSSDQRKKLRTEKSIPVLQELESWMKEQLPEVLPKSSIGQAIAYTLGLWPRLTRYTQNGQVEIDNNLIENSIRPMALGRKNYLFAGSHEAAQQAAMIYSFLGTCKINNIEPYSWLKETLTRIPDHSIRKLDELLPC